jgi:hypothetical protein
MASRELEVTPQMRQAGSEVLQSLLQHGSVSYEFVAEQIYKTMMVGVAAPKYRSPR